MTLLQQALRVQIVESSTHKEFYYVAFIRVAKNSFHRVPSKRQISFAPNRL